MKLLDVFFLFLSAGAAGVAGTVLPVAQGEELNTLQRDFFAPPAAVRSGVYWYFMDGNLSREGMTKDLEAMKRAGLNSVVFLEVNVGVPRGKVDFLSKPWRDLFGHAVRECERLGISFVLGTGPGWAGSGGPWVTPQQAMKHLVCSTTTVAAGSAAGTGAGALNATSNAAAPVRVTLPVPAPKRPFFADALPPAQEQQRREYYEDVAVLAFPAGASRFGTELTATGRERKWGAYWNFPQSDARALYYRQPVSSAPETEACFPTASLYTARAGDSGVAPADVIDVTRFVKKSASKKDTDLVLEWTPPHAGEWTLMRFAVRNTGAGTRPAPKPGWGFEADKFSRSAMQAHLDAYVGALFKHIGFKRAHADGSGLQTLHIDSWEMGAQNWTDGFRAEFTRRRGYDPLPFFPALDGVLVADRLTSERFLWDLRVVAQELVRENHVAFVREYAAKFGLKTSIEPYDMNPASDLELGVTADLPMCEFWTEGRGLNTAFSVIEATSAAHLIGQPVVGAEAFTAHGDAWRQHPASVKNQGDWAFAAGVNRFFYHTFQHQPLPDDKRPGMTMGPYGVHWDRNQTWWEFSRRYHDYVARCSVLLRAGRAVADVLYLTPEGAPHVFKAPPSAFSGTAHLPDRRGHNFDACPPSMLFKASVGAGGKIVFPSGAEYQLLVLPKTETMTPELLGKIVELANAGARIVAADAPVRSPSLSGQPASDERVRELADKLWKQTNGKQTDVKKIRTGSGLYAGASIECPYPNYEITAGILEEFERTRAADFAEPTGTIRYTHRTAGSAEIYFLSNKTAQVVHTDAQFRVAGKVPALWHPEHGTIRGLPVFQEGRIPLRFEPHESYFIVFTNVPAASPAAAPTVNFAEPQTLLTLDAPWSVSFDPRWGGPAAPVVFKTLSKELSDWSRHADSAVRYYSGTAVYKTRFSLPQNSPALRTARLWLDLGDVKNIARARLNGVELGTAWCPPWRLPIPRTLNGAPLRAGENVLEIEVANLWTNRLVGDEALPAAKRLTFTTRRHYRKNSPLAPSGLLAPVRLIEWEPATPAH